MADSKQLSYSVLNASEEVVDNPCNICLTRDNKDIESSNYCIDCDSNLCNTCTKWHTEFPLMRSHTVVSISNAALGHRQRMPLPTQLCREHHGNIIDKFCLDHDAIACDSCVSIYHSKCKRIRYIPLVAKDTKKGKETNAIIKTSQSLLKKLKDMKSSRQDTLKQLQTAERQSRQAVKDQRDDLIKWIDGLAKTDSATITSKFQEQEVAVKKEIKNVDDQIDATELTIKHLNASNGDNTTELFIYIKQGEKTEKDGEQLLHTLQPSRTNIPKYKFHNSVEKSLSQIWSLGEFEKDTVRDRPKPVTLKLMGEHSVQSAGDALICDIRGACFLPDGSVMIADWNNQNIKHVDSSYNVTDYLSMSSKPCDVCYTNNNNEVAVALINEKQIQFVRVGPRFKRTPRSFSTGDYCRCIAFSDGELFVGCGDAFNQTAGNVRVYNLAGTLLRTIHLRHFSVIWCLSVSSCGRKLHITDENNGIITTNRQGSLLTTFADPELERAAGVCTLDNGDLLVCDYGSDKILHVSKDGRKMGVVLGGKDGIVKPQALAYDSVTSTLMVTTDMSATINVYGVHLN